MGSASAERQKGALRNVVPGDAAKPILVTLGRSPGCRGSQRWVALQRAALVRIDDRPISVDAGSGAGRIDAG